MNITNFRTTNLQLQSRDGPRSIVAGGASSFALVNTNSCTLIFLALFFVFRKVTWRWSDRDSNFPILDSKSNSLNYIFTSTHLHAFHCRVTRKEWLWRLLALKERRQGLTSLWGESSCFIARWTISRSEIVSLAISLKCFLWRRLPWERSCCKIRPWTIWVFWVLVINLLRVTNIIIRD